METAEKKRVLILEDEAHIAQGIKLNLTLQGYEAKVAADGVEGLEKWRAWQPDLIVLDIMLPMIDGFSILQTIRREDEKIPVLILSARADTKDKVRGLKYGVDDYLAKPFDLEEFLLRVERLVTRKQWYVQPEKKEKKSGCPLFEGTSYSFGTNHIDFVTSTAQCAAGQVILTEQEIALLRIFIAHKGKPLSRKMLLKAGWGYARGTTTRTVDNFIVRFRKYFEPRPKSPVYFKSRRSVGYIFEPGE